MALLTLSNEGAPGHFFHLMEAPTMRLPSAKTLLCWPSRMQIYGLVENHTFLEQFVSRGVPGHFYNLGVPGHFFNLGVPGHFFNLGVPGHFFNLGVPGHFFNLGLPGHFFNLGVPGHFFNLGVPGHFFNLAVPGHFFNLGVPGHFFQSGGTRTIFSTLHGSLWLSKDKGSIMEGAEICDTI